MVVSNPPATEELPEYSLPELINALHSPVEDQRHEAIYMLSELLSFAYGEDGRLLGEAMRMDLSPLILTGLVSRLFNAEWPTPPSRRRHSRLGKIRMALPSARRCACPRLRSSGSCCVPA